MESSLPEPTMITRRGSLLKMVETLSRETILAVDTESNSLYAYREQVCLIQFSTTAEDYLVDPLALDDLSPLGPLFRDPKIEKVFHAAEYDLIGMVRDFGFKFTNLFDTMLAASILGRTEIGLGSLLEREFGILLDKRFQRANWSQRPLPRDLLSYARLDTRYLIPLRDRLKVELEDAGRWAMAEEDFTRLCLVGERFAGHAAQNASDSKEELCWRISGTNELTPQQMAVLNELCRYRDKIARALNRPLFKVFSDETMLAIAASTPRDVQGLRNLPGMSRGQLGRHANEILKAVERGVHAKPLYPPEHPRPDDQFLNRIDRLRQWRKAKAQELGVKSDVILSRDLLFSLASHYPKTMDELKVILHEVPWRLENYGPQILKILSHSKKS